MTYYHQDCPADIHGETNKAPWYARLVFIADYAILRNVTEEALAREVREYLTKGYGTVGGVAIGNGIFYQAVEKVRVHWPDIRSDGAPNA